MLSRSPIWVFSLIVAMLLLFGCTSVRNENTLESASPTPTNGPQQAASHSALRTTGHTEAHGGGGLNTGEKEHCFQRDNTRDLVLTFTDPAVQTGTVSAFLIDNGSGTVVEDIPTITKDPKDPTGSTANIRFSDPQAPGAKRRTIPPMHLGPGPYTEVTIVDPTGAEGQGSARSKLRTGDVYPYITVDDPKTQCP